MSTNYYINKVVDFFKKQSIFVIILTTLLWVLLQKLIEPVKLSETYSFNLSFIFSGLVPTASAPEVVVNGVIFSNIKKVYSIIAFIGLLGLSNSIYERFLYNLFSREKEVKWYDVKNIKHPFDKDELKIVLGKVYNEHDNQLSRKPYYESIREKGLFQNILIIGTIGTGKTISAIVPIALQLIYLFSDSVKDKAAMLFLDVKGNFYKFVFAFAIECSRWNDIIALELGGKWKYNPLHKPNLSEIELAHRIRTIVELTSGSSSDSEKYWIDKAEDTITEYIKLIRLYNNGYVNFEELHKIGTKKEYRDEKMILIEGFYQRDELSEEQKYMYTTAKEYFQNEYNRLIDKAQTFIQSEITRITQPFISTKIVKDTFSPSVDEINFYGFEDVIKEGKIVVWKINANKHPKVAKMIAAYLKLDFQKESLITLDKKDTDPVSYKRLKVTVCDEYQEYATSGDADYLSQSREPNSITVASTQSYSSVKKALKNDETMTNMLLQSFVNKIWLRTDDAEYTIPKILKLIGKVDKEKITTSITESSRNSKVNYALGKVLGKGKNLSSGTTISVQKEHLFDETFLSQKLSLGQAVCFLSDGENVVGPKVIHLSKFFEGRLICNENSKISYTTDKELIFKNVGDVDIDKLENSVFPEEKEDTTSANLLKDIELEELKESEKGKLPSSFEFIVKPKEKEMYKEIPDGEIKEEKDLEEEKQIEMDIEYIEEDSYFEKNIFDNYF